MVYFIIIRGPLGIGKSTIAQKLAKPLDAQYISVDKVLEEHNLDKVKDEKWIPAENFIKAQEIILPKVKKIKYIYKHSDVGGINLNKFYEEVLNAELPIKVVMMKNPLLAKEFKQQILNSFNKT